ncbi:hypothetical protein ACMZ6Y_07725 [Streptococcus pluranimalium]
MVKMELGASSAQANSVSSMSASRVAGYQAAMTSLSSFSVSDSLSGNAYNNAKAYATGILVPLMQGGILLSQGIAKAAAKLPADYVSEVAPESLDSDVLEEQIALQKTLLASAESQFKSASKLKDPIAKQETQLRAGQSMARLNAKINELEEKLEKLLAFDEASAQIFSEIAALKQAVDQGLAMVTSDFKGASSIPTIKGRSLPWVKTINTSVAKFSDDGEEAAKLLDNQILKEKMKEYENKVEVETNSAAQLDKESRELLKQAEDDYKNGLITLETYQSLKSGLIAGGASFIKELAQNKITDEAVEGFTKKTWEWLVQSSENMQVGAVGATIGGGNYTVPINVNPAYSSLVSGVAKYGAPVIGSAIDFTMQVEGGEDVTDAAIKTGAHVAIASGAVIVGKSAGSAVAAGLVASGFGAPLAPIAGVATDFTVTSVISIGGSWLFDTVYDNQAAIVQLIGDGIENVGDAISDTLSTWGSALGW